MKINTMVPPTQEQIVIISLRGCIHFNSTVIKLKVAEEILSNTVLISAVVSLSIQYPPELTSEGKVGKEESIFYKLFVIWFAVSESPPPTIY